MMPSHLLARFLDFLSFVPEHQASLKLAQVVNDLGVGANGVEILRLADQDLLDVLQGICWIIVHQQKDSPFKETSRVLGFT